MLVTKARTTNRETRKMNKNGLNKAEIIKAAREFTKMSQTEFGEITGLGKTTVSNYETGYSAPSWETVGKIADILGMAFPELLRLGSSGDEPINLNLPRVSQVTNDKIIPVLSNSALKNFDPEYPLANARKFISLPGSMLSGDGSYICIQATDGTMRGCRIKKNDRLFVRVGSTPSDNDIVVVISSKDDAVLIRRFSRREHIIELSPAPITPKNEVILTHERNSEFKIVGIVEKILTTI